MYHDQGLLPFKTLSFDQGVNFTSGLNIIRTSPSHGTAFEIAGKNTASPTSFREALYTGVDVFKNRFFVIVFYNFARSHHHYFIRYCFNYF